MRDGEGLTLAPDREDYLREFSKESDKSVHCIGREEGDNGLGVFHVFLTTCVCVGSPCVCVCGVHAYTCISICVHAYVHTTYPSLNQVE